MSKINGLAGLQAALGFGGYGETEDLNDELLEVGFETVERLREQFGARLDAALADRDRDDTDRYGTLVWKMSDHIGTDDFAAHAVVAWIRKIDPEAARQGELEVDEEEDGIFGLAAWMAAEHFARS